jgi:nitroreductase
VIAAPAGEMIAAAPGEVIAAAAGGVVGGSPNAGPRQSTRRMLHGVINSAIRAPSVHNTQPWAFAIARTTLEIRADRSRQLVALDPAGRELLVSCGAALMNARVALAHRGIRAAITRFPDPQQPDLVARIDIGPAAHRSRPALARLAPVITVRHTNRRAFADEPVPRALLTVVRRAARAEGGVVRTLRGTDRAIVAAAARRADTTQLLDPAYRAELRAWTSDDPTRLDGVPAVAVPHVDAGSHDELPIRDFDTRGAGVLPIETRSSANQCLLLLGTERDDPASWLRAGEALERMLLEIARHGFTASPLTQAVEVESTRAELRRELGLGFWPHILLRVGRAAPTAGTPRRHAADVVIDVE